jgi:molybdate transport system substrate-binding protein
MTLSCLATQAVCYRTVQFQLTGAAMKMRISLALLFLSALSAGVLSGQSRSSENVKVYAAAVVKSPLTAIAADYEKTTGNKVTLIFDTAGATLQRFQADPQADLLITNIQLIQNAGKAGNLSDGKSEALGSTVASVAVRPQFPKPDVSSPEKLKAALLAAKRIAVSDPARGATVGTHFMKVIEALGIKDEVLKKTTFAPDGIATMHLVLDEGIDLGVSQSSEILQANPDAMAGPFPQVGPAGSKRLAAEGILPPSSR